ncbi:apolipoprotein N-acyltransferase [Lysobacter xanthus]
MGAALSGVLVALYARGAWPLAFVVLVPWRLALARVHGLRDTLWAGVAMAVAFVAAGFGWFAPAVSDYTGLAPAVAFALLLVAAPLLQPQLVAFALVRARAARRHGAAVTAVLAIAAWLATEWLVPRVFDDTLGQGLQPSRLLRQGADLAGTSGLTLLALVVNEAVSRAIERRKGLRDALLRAIGVALLVPIALAGYGAMRLAQIERLPAGTPLRIGLVQAAIVDYERLRARIGAYAVVRRVLDAHYGLSEELRAQGVDALVWPETVYPTTFGQPRSEAGAELDRELTGFVARSGVPLVFGTYDRDDAGEYNAAAFVDPARGPLGAYRKTRLFPLTEYVPPMLDGAMLRGALPWAGTWRPGDGARVFPLFTAGGREVPVAPLICRDDLDPMLTRDGARLGARLLVGLSNDAWFTRDPQGARLHLQSAALRSVETRLPQVRATTNGLSAVVDASGDVVARTRMGERTVLLATVSLVEMPPTLFVRTGDWIGPGALLVALGGAFASVRRRARPGAAADAESSAIDEARDRTILLLRPWRRHAIGALRALARIAVLALAAQALFAAESPGMLAQLRVFAIVVLAPEVLAALLAVGCRATLRVDADRLVLDSRSRRIEIERAQIVGMRPWRLPWPAPGVDIAFRDGRRWSHGLAGAGVLALADRSFDGTRRQAALDALDLPRARLDHALLKFGLFPLLPALPAFRLHQVIAYGSAFGEYYTFGATAYLRALALWWGSWAVALVLIAAGLRLVAELGSATALALRPHRTRPVRRQLLALARLAYFIGVPAWLGLRLLGG